METHTGTVNGLIHTEYFFDCYDIRHYFLLVSLYRELPSDKYIKPYRFIKLIMFLCWEKECLLF